MLEFNDYINTTVFCKLETIKLKIVSTDRILEKAIISLEKFPDSDENLYIIVRLPNKTTIYYGILTHASKINIIPRK